MTAESEKTGWERVQGGDGGRYQRSDFRNQAATGYTKGLPD
jgi:hypothetical protein